MKKHVWFITICLVAFVAGYSINSKAVSDTGFRVAVVDIPELISKSTDMTILKSEQQKKLDLMKTTFEKAQSEISKETDPQKIQQLEDKYRNEINEQKLALETEYNEKLKQIDSNIKNTVISKAKGMQYNLVLPKNVVLFGGDDITPEVAKMIK